MRQITFTIPGEPQGKQRVRSALIRNRIHTYNTEHNEREANRTLFWFLHAVRESRELWPPLEQAEVEITAYYGLPKGKSKAWRAAALAGEHVPVRKPDLDNITKLILDALNGAAYVDD
ncbi:MAG: RusA family crossover junction endodeoxyribonuclease, partial [Abditibacteriota bacterium]|nr:RusA family crossover junction endodeoxyribonuclease [Abditibacteriota bacterium]